MHRLIAPRILAVTLAALISACSSASRLAPYPHESVLSVIAELKIFLRSDPYTRPPGRDLDGQNIYRVSLARLNAIEPLAGEQYHDVLSYARGECYERLGQWDAARESFVKAGEAKTLLSDEAAVRAEWTRRIAQITGEPAEVRTLDAYLNHLDAMMSKLIELRQGKPAFPYESFLSAELERTLEKKAAILFANRLIIPKGVDLATEAAQKLVDDHAASWRAAEHRLLLGRFYEERAIDYALLFDPGGVSFDVGQWTKWVDEARAAYTKVAQTDGDPAKPEGQARLRALDAFSQRTLEAAR